MAELSDEGPDIAVSEGFSLVPLVLARSRGCSGRTWVRMIHPDCAAQVDFVNPTQQRVDHYAAIHNCDATNWMVG